MGEDRTLETIWNRRSKAFRKETLPYFRYMGQSGFPAFMSLILISSAIGYISLIRNLPANFPITLVGVVSLLLVLSWSPLRTWLEAGDIVFMMPREAEMDSYLRRSFLHTSLGCSILAAIVILLYLPIYNQGPAVSGGWLLALAAAVLKAGNVWGAWRERQIAWPGMRRLMRLLRWAGTALLLAAWLTCLAWQAAVFTVLVGLLLFFIYRLPARHRFPWERLIEEEARTRKRYYVFFGLFIDVPTLPSSVAKRSYLTWLLGVIPYSNRNTFVYLFTAALLRTEMGGIILRLLFLGCLITYWFSEAVSLSGWGCIIVFAIFMGLIAVQLGGLRHVHRYSVWKHVYPLPEKQRVEQYVKVDRLAMVICAAVLWIFAELPLALSNVYLPSLTAGAILLVYMSIRPARLRKKMLADEDEE
ncbi:ABC-2 type transport system permease protein [Paenibacillus castaneae]|uniref:ABC transporter permease n=1 Tax=Paenibacillus castaneae TaxID=474957 RepID=UPI000C9B97AE|nr:ABC transporter permease [Paenibacillus castaneae]NIK76065.1 ABC-2 type transport system permease protein [Paenibacillus castaneae]